MVHWKLIELNHSKILSASAIQPLDRASGSIWKLSCLWHVHQFFRQNPDIKKKMMVSGHFTPKTLHLDLKSSFFGAHINIHNAQLDTIDSTIFKKNEVLVAIFVCKGHKMMCW